MSEVLQTGANLLQNRVLFGLHFSARYNEFMHPCEQQKPFAFCLMWNGIPFIWNSSGEALQKVDCTLMKLFKCEVCGQIQDYFSRNDQSQYTVDIYCHVH